MCVCLVLYIKLASPRHLCHFWLLFLPFLFKTPQFRFHLATISGRAADTSYRPRYIVSVLTEGDVLPANNSSD